MARLSRYAFYICSFCPQVLRAIAAQAATVASLGRLALLTLPEANGEYEGHSNPRPLTACATARSHSELRAVRPRPNNIMDGLRWESN